MNLYVWDWVCVCTSVSEREDQPWMSPAESITPTPPAAGGPEGRLQLHTTLSAQPIHHRGSTPITAYHWCQATLVCCVWIPAHGRHVNAANSLSSTPNCTGLVGKCRCYTQKAKNKKMNHAVPRRDHRTESETSWCSNIQHGQKPKASKVWRHNMGENVKRRNRWDKDGPRQM